MTADGVPQREEERPEEEGGGYSAYISTQNQITFRDFSGFGSMTFGWFRIDDFRIDKI